jgi:hypothetical protein
MARPKIALGELRGAQGERQGLFVVAERVEVLEGDWASTGDVKRPAAPKSAA